MLIEKVTQDLAMKLAIETDALIKQGLDAVLGEGNWVLKDLPGRLLCQHKPGLRTYLVDGVRMFSMTEPEFIVRGMTADLKYQVYHYVGKDAEQQTNGVPEAEQSTGGL